MASGSANWLKLSAKYLLSLAKRILKCIITFSGCRLEQAGAFFSRTLTNKTS